MTDHHPLAELLNDELDRIEMKMGVERAVYERLWALLFVVIGGGLSVGFGGNWQVMLVLPLVALQVALINLAAMREHQALAGYKHYLEENLNELARHQWKRDLALWESHVVPTVPLGRTTSFITASLSMILFGSLWAASYAAAPPEWEWVAILGATISLPTILFGFHEVSGARNKVLREARKRRATPESSSP